MMLLLALLLVAPASGADFNLAPDNPSHLLARAHVPAHSSSSLQVQLASGKQSESDSEHQHQTITGLRVLVLVDEAWDEFVSSGSTTCGRRRGGRRLSASTIRQYPVSWEDIDEDNYKLDLQLDNTHHEHARNFFIVAEDCALQAYGSTDEATAIQFEIFRESSFGSSFWWHVALNLLMVQFLFNNCGCNKSNQTRKSYRCLLAALACHSLCGVCQALNTSLGDEIFSRLRYLLISASLALVCKENSENRNRELAVMFVLSIFACRAAAPHFEELRASIICTTWVHLINFALGIWSAYRRQWVATGWFSWHAVYPILCSLIIPIHLHEHWVSTWITAISTSCLFVLCLWEAAGSVSVLDLLPTRSSDSPTPLLSYSLTSPTKQPKRSHRWLLPAQIFASPTHTGR